jgi:hypothetical protein
MTPDDIKSALLVKQSVRLSNQVKRDKDQTTIANPGNYDPELGLFVGVEADGSQVRYRPGKDKTAPNQISIVKTAHTQAAFGDWL